MSTIRDRLQLALGDSYQISHELGGGGMSHVYVADEVKLKRKVVIKLLPPEASAAVHADRFSLEIEVAASLSHPHIVPLLAAGEADGLLWYAMPFIDGESLAERLDRGGPLPAGEVIRIIRDVADALAEAHARGVVHRDIKPANILLRGRHALVADFGVAKALAAAGTGGGAALTGMGIALGTPAYMAPEQAAADPNTDHRADLYSLGIVAYEALTGRLPFDRGTPQEMIAAHIAKPPLDIRIAAPTIPADLAEAVMRCLAKRPAERWKNADALVAWCEQRGTPSGGSGVDPAVTSAHRALNQWSTRRVASLYPMVAVIGVAITFAVTYLIGLPNWIWWTAAALASIGVPIVWNAARHERRRATATLTGLDLTPPGGTAPWRSGNRALQFGGIAVLLVVLLAVGWLGSRAAGIGPWKTLLSAGTLSSGDRILMGEFENRTTDSTLSGAVMEALRVDLSQSRSIRLVDPRDVRAALIRANHNPDSVKVFGAVAREVAERENAKIVLTGMISAVGSGYVLTASLLDVVNDSSVAEIRVDASGPDDLIPAINRLSGKVRERIGESLRTIRSGDPLAQVTTASLPALRLYSEANLESGNSNWVGAAALLEQAVALDTAFAMAWRKLSVAYANMGVQPERARLASANAMKFLHRLPPLERHLTEARYYSGPGNDRERAITAYRAVLAIQPDEPTAVNNLGMLLSGDGRFREAAAILTPAVASGKAPFSTFLNLQFTAISLGDTAQADSLSGAWLRAGGDSGQASVLALQMAISTRDVDLIDSLGKVSNRLLGNSPLRDINRGRTQLAVAAMRGQYQRMDALRAELASTLLQNDNPGDALRILLSESIILATTLGRTQAAVDRMEELLREHPLDSIAPLDRPYWDIAEVYAWNKQPTEVERYHREWSAAREGLAAKEEERLLWEAMAGTANQRWEEVARVATRANSLAPCHPCGVYYVGLAWDRAGNADSALTWLTKAVTKMETESGGEDPMFYPYAMLRLGELHADRGQREQAAGYLQRFLTLWRNADAELQPMVKRGRVRLAEVSGEPR
jgi:tetratricopeptide (TPR) repeat protein